MEGGRAPSQALTCRTSEAEHSFAIDNEACAAPKKYSKKTFSINWDRAADWFRHGLSLFRFSANCPAILDNPIYPKGTGIKIDPSKKQTA